MSPFRSWLDEERAQNPKIFMPVFLISGLYAPESKGFLFISLQNELTNSTHFLLVNFIPKFDLEISLDSI